jgi:hypothetical protein
VTDQRYDRFRRLERPRAAGPDQAPAPDGTDARIEAVEGPEPAATSGGGDPASGGDLERFRAAPERALELDRPGPETQPFLRCAACETDNFRTAARCTTCAADLETEPQRLFNRRLWAARQAEAAAEARTSAERKAQLDLQVAADAEQRRQAAETMAREVGEAERRRLDGEGYGTGWTDPLAPTWAGGTRPGPLLLRWLRTLPISWAIAAGLLLLLVPAVLFLIRPLFGLLAGVVLIALFMPPRRRSWFDWRDWS